MRCFYSYITTSYKNISVGYNAVYLLNWENPFPKKWKSIAHMFAVFPQIGGKRGQDWRYADTLISSC